MNPGDGGSSTMAEVGDGKFDGRNARGDRCCREPAVREEVSSIFVELDSVALKLGKQLALAHATDANGPGYRGAVRVDGNAFVFTPGLHAETPAITVSGMLTARTRSDPPHACSIRLHAASKKPGPST
jgi:hypothetical protein